MRERDWKKNNVISSLLTAGYHPELKLSWDKERDDKKTASMKEREKERKAAECVGDSRFLWRSSM